MSPFLNAVLGLAALASASGGFTSLSLAMDRHWADLHGRGSAPTPAQSRRLRMFGIGGLLLSLLVCLQAWGSAQGWVAWAGMLTFAALGLSLTLAYAARAVVLAGYCAAAVTCLALLAAMLA